MNQKVTSQMQILTYFVMHEKFYYTFLLLKGMNQKIIEFVVFIKFYKVWFCGK